MVVQVGGGRKEDLLHGRVVRGELYMVVVKVVGEKVLKKVGKISFFNSFIFK